MTDWQPQSVALSLQLSDFTLARLPLRVQVRQAAHQPDEVAPPGPPQPPAMQPAPGVDGFLVRAMPVDASVAPLQRCSEWITYVADPYQHFTVDLRLGFDAYKGRFSSKSRSTITRKVAKFARYCGGSLKWKRYTSASELLEFHRQARVVSARTYQERLLDAGLPDSPEFLARMQAAAAQDRVRAFLLFDGDRPVSYLYCPIEGDTVIYAYVGYAPEYVKHSVGTVLFWLAIESMFSESRYTCFDFTEGETDHKRHFATHGCLSANVYFLRPSRKLLLAVQAHHRFSRWAGALRSWLERRGWKVGIRRFMRFGRSGTGAGVPETLLWVMGCAMFGEYGLDAGILPWATSGTLAYQE